VGRGGFRTAVAHAPFERWTRFVLRRRIAVLVVWLAVLVAGAIAMTALPPRLVSSFAVPGTDSDRAASALAHGFGERPEGTFTVVFRVRDADPATVKSLKGRLVRAASAVPGSKIGAFRAGPGVVYGEVETALGLQQAKGLTDRLRAALRRQGGPPVLVTGQPAVQHDLEPQLARDLRRGELLALPVALLVLAVALGVSAALALPFVFAACTVAGALALLYLAALFGPITPYALNLVQLIGLGLAIDYSLLVVFRFREELVRDGARSDAIVRTMASAGRSVAFSGTAVAIGLALLLVLPVPFIRGLGVAGLLIPVVAVAAAFTLQPALLSFWPVRARAARRRHWAGHGSARLLAVTTLALVAAAVPLFFVDVSPGTLSGLPQRMESARGLTELRAAFGPGAVTPTDVVVDTHRAGGARAPAVRAAVERLSTLLFADPEVYVVALGRSAPYVSADARYVRVRVVGRHDFGAADSRRLVTRIRGDAHSAARFPRGLDVTVGGAAPQGVDFLARTYAYFPWVVLAALALTYLVLARAFRSVFLPLKAVLLNLLSVGATYGLLALIFGSIDGWIPILLFATLFGLSMDYEVFLVSRICEARAAGHSTRDAIAVGLGRTRGVITAAAAVMTASFAGFVVGSIPGLRQLGVGLVIAVLIDATLVRIVLVPSIMTLMGRWNWWLPRRLAGKRLALLAGMVALGLAAPASASAAPTIRLVIAHVVSHCHVWRTQSKSLGASARVFVKPGARLVIRADCPMDFDYVQRSGPRLPLGNPRTLAGTARVITFRRVGIYRLQVTNVQTPEERGLLTLGETNTLLLTVVVH
jgi:RND superfamily putative drug exporter